MGPAAPGPEKGSPAGLQSPQATRAAWERPLDQAETMRLISPALLST